MIAYRPDRQHDDQQDHREHQTQDQHHGHDDEADQLAE
jgi:hypothetical protein